MSLFGYPKNPKYFAVLWHLGWQICKNTVFWGFMGSQVNAKNTLFTNLRTHRYMEFMICRKKGVKNGFADTCTGTPKLTLNLSRVFG